MTEYDTTPENDDEPTYEQKAALRARYEGMCFRVPAPGRVRVENASYGDESDEHVYVVAVAEHIGTTSCTCPSDEYRAGKCKHRRAVENQPAVMQAATKNLSGAYPDKEVDTGQVERHPIMTDGGRETDRECAACGRVETVDMTMGTDGAWYCVECIPEHIHSIMTDGDEDLDTCASCGRVPNPDKWLTALLGDTCIQCVLEAEGAITRNRMPVADASGQAVVTDGGHCDDQSADDDPVIITDGGVDVRDGESEMGPDSDDEAGTELAKPFSVTASGPVDYCRHIGEGMFETFKIEVNIERAIATVEEFHRFFELHESGEQVADAVEILTEERAGYSFDEDDLSEWTIQIDGPVVAYQSAAYEFSIHDEISWTDYSRLTKNCVSCYLFGPGARIAQLDAQREGSGSVENYVRDFVDELETDR